MTATPVFDSAANADTGKGRYRFGDLVRMEWIKLRSLRSTWATLTVTILAAVGIGVGTGAHTEDAGVDVTSNILAGITPGLLLIGVLGVLAVTSEYTSGLVRSTLTVAPARSRVLAAKAAVVGVVALVVGEIASFAAMLAGGAAVPGGIPAPSLGDAGVLRAVVLTGAGFGLVSLLGVGLGAIIRHTPAAVAALVGGIYVAGTLLVVVSESAGGFGPISIVANSLSTTQQLTHALSPWAGLGMLGLYTVVALGVGGLVFGRRDA